MDGPTSIWRRHMAMWHVCGWKRGVPHTEAHAEMLRLRRDDPAEFRRQHSVQIMAVRLLGIVMYSAVVSVLVDVLVSDAR